ncbi:hypothetical protein GQ457_02G021120 [Hibiscus cannabinus]
MLFQHSPLKGAGAGAGDSICQWFPYMNEQENPSISRGGKYQLPNEEHLPWSGRHFFLVPFRVTDQISML